MVGASVIFLVMLLVSRFRVAAEREEEFLARARRALALLTMARGCRRGSLGRAVDATDRWVLVVEFDSVVAYRRALSPFQVREEVVPLLAEALVDEPGAYETLAEATGGEVTNHASLLAQDP